MVTKLKDNLAYIIYIRKKMNESFSEWEEAGTAYEKQPNNNFGISFKKENHKVQFIKDRGLLELRIYDVDNLVYKGDSFYNSILENVPDQDPKWGLALCTELIDYYIRFLKQHFYSEI